MPKAVGGVGGDPRVEQVLQDVQARGITVSRGPEEGKRLAQVGASASYLFTEGEPGLLIVGEDPEYVAVRHEGYHSIQHEARDWHAPGSDEIPAMEVETYRYVLDHAEEWGLSPEEVVDNRTLLRHYQAQLPDQDRPPRLP